MKVLLVGSGQMAYEYWKVLDALGCHVTVAGRGLDSAKLFHEKTGTMPLLKPLGEIINSETINFAIVATSVENLAPVCIDLLQLQVKNILLEKPGALYKKDLDCIYSLSNQFHANVLIAYNRRFYESVLQAKEIIRDDGGILSAHFDFTEWSHQIIDLPISHEVKQRWFLANSSHIVDLVWHLIGSPKELVSNVSGSLPWHES
jgi:predicted dehydrogenase